MPRIDDIVSDMPKFGKITVRLSCGHVATFDMPLLAAGNSAWARRAWRDWSLWRAECDMCERNEEELHAD
jgi:hypothetical protein